MVPCNIIHICIFSILNALQERRDERKRNFNPGDIQQIEVYEKAAWQEFWEDESKALLLYSCLHGNVDIVKYFLNTQFVSPTIRYYFIFVTHTLHVPKPK